MNTGDSNTVSRKSHFCAGKTGTASHFRFDIGCCFNELRLRKWWQSPVFPNVEITVNGVAAEVTNKVGWPGEAGIYRIDFRLPGGIAADQAVLQLTAAWMSAEEVKIPVQ